MSIYLSVYVLVAFDTYDIDFRCASTRYYPYDMLWL